MGMALRGRDGGNQDREVPLHEPRDGDRCWICSAGSSVEV